MFFIFALPQFCMEWSCRNETERIPFVLTALVGISSGDETFCLCCIQAKASTVLETVTTLVPRRTQEIASQRIGLLRFCYDEFAAVWGLYTQEKVEGGIQWGIAVLGVLVGVCFKCI